jgi:hypothetical protein
MPLARQFAFPTAGCPGNGGARNREAVVRSSFGLVFMTCGAWPPCRKVRSLVHVGGETSLVTLQGREWGDLPLKRGRSPAVGMPRSSCDHCVLPPSGPPDGVCWCSPEGSASRSFLPATLPSESGRPWWCRRSCLLPAAIGGVQPHGGWHPFTALRLQGFSSCSPAAVPRRWSPRRMTTSFVVGRSKSGCGFPPALSFKDVHHPRWGGRRVEPGFCLPRGPAARFFLQHSREERGSPATRRRRTSATQGRPGAGADSCRVPGSWPGWPCHRLRCCLLPFSRGVAVCPLHGRRSCRVRVRHIHSFSRAAGRTGGPSKTSYAAGVAATFLDGFVLTPWEDGSEGLLCGGGRGRRC